MATGDIKYHYNGIYKDLGGQFLLDPNEFNGWGGIGPFDDTNAQDLSDVGGDPANTAGGYIFPFDVRIKKFFAIHRNSNASTLPWGWRIFHQEKVYNSSTRTNVDIYRECTGTGSTAVAPNDYGNNLPQETDVDLDILIPAGNVVCLGAESPTAVGTNYYVQIQTGYLYFERV